MNTHLYYITGTITVLIGIIAIALLLNVAGFIVGGVMIILGMMSYMLGLILDAIRYNTQRILDNLYDLPYTKNDVVG